MAMVFWKANYKLRRKGVLIAIWGGIGSNNPCEKHERGLFNPKK